jgi:hypothetical protein
MKLNGFKVFAHVTAIGIIVGAATAPIAQPGHAEFVLLSADSPLSGSDTAIILGGTFAPTPSTAYAQAAEDLYLHPLGFDGGATGSTVCDMIGTDPCSAPLQVLTTPELLQQGPSTLTGASDIVLAVENEFNADPGAFSAEHPLTVFGYSQSAAADSIAMTQLAEAGIPSDDLHFVFIGDVADPDGAWPNIEADLDAWLGPSTANALINALDLHNALDLKSVLGLMTPDDLYPATIYTLDTDGAADWQEDYDAGGMNAGGFLDSIVHVIFQHVEYLGLTPLEIADATTLTDGDLTYIDISDNINNLAAWVDALDHGVVSSGLLQSLFDSLELVLTNSF